MLKEKVIAIVAGATKHPGSKVTAESTFESLGLDSLDALNILYELEKEFDVRFPNEEVLGIRSIPHLVERLEQFLAYSAPKP
jgi:acyl carrier protein